MAALVPASTRTFAVRMISGAVLVVVFVVGLMFWSLEQSLTTYERKVTTTADNLKQLLVTDLGKTFDGVDEVLMILQEDFRHWDSHDRTSNDFLPKRIAALLARHPEIATLRMTDANGEVIYGFKPGESPQGNGAGGRPYFQRLQTNPQAGLVISEPLKGKISGKWGLIFARRLEGVDGQFAGVVFANLPLDYFTHRFSTLALEKEDSIALRDAGLGLIARHPDVSSKLEIGSTRISDEFRAALAVSREAGSYTSGVTSIDSISRYHTYQLLPKYGYLLNVGISKQAALALWNKEREAVWSVISAFVMILAAAIVSSIRARSGQDRQAEHLRESEQRYRHLIEQSPVPIALNNDRLEVVFVNAAFERIVGYTVAEIPTLEDWWPKAYPDPAYRKEVMAAWQEHMEASDQLRKPFEPLEVEVRCGNGESRTMLVSAGSPSGDTDTVHLVTLVDISDHKRAEQFASRYQDIVESSYDAIISKNLSGIVTSWNQGAEVLFGYRGEEIIGQPITRLFPQDRLDEESLILTRVACGLHMRNYETVRIRKDGSQVDISVTLSPIRGLDGRVIGISKIAHDISEKKQAERLLAQHKDELERLVERRTGELYDTQFAMDRAGIGIHWIDSGNGRILYVNNYAADMLGFTVEEMLALSIQDVYPSLPPGGLTDAFGHTSAAGALHLESVQQSKDGPLIPVDIVGYALPQRADQPGRIITFITDITERKAAEQILRDAKADAELASEAKSEFLANMSHEIRTPLNGVLGLAQIGYRDNAGHRKAQESFARILDSGRLLLTIINDILDFSKIEARKLDIESVPFNPAVIAEEVCSAIRMAASAKDLTLASDVGNVPEACLGDPHRIEQVLLNLMSNAIKFTETGEIRLTVRLDGDDLVYSVSDTGVGINPEALERLFLPFEQADHSTTRKYGGTGLGLAISRRLAELMGGTLKATSTEGLGSCFELRMPAIRTDQPAPLRMAGHMLSHGKRLDGITLLVAEDNEVNRIVIEDMLTAEGAYVIMTENGREAVDAVRRQADIELVLMDVQMPEMDGLEATRRIKAIRPDLPVVGQTAHALKEERDKCLAAGMSETVIKPIELEQLVSVILNRVGRPASQPPDATTPSKELAAPTVVDWATLEARYRNRPAFVDKLIRISIETHGDDEERILTLIKQQDVAGLEKIAHAIKGFAGNLDAIEVQQLALQTLSAARQNEPGVLAYATNLAAAMKRLIKALRDSRR